MATMNNNNEQTRFQIVAALPDATTNNATPTEDLDWYKFGRANPCQWFAVPGEARKVGSVLRGRQQKLNKGVKGQVGRWETAQRSGAVYTRFGGDPIQRLPQSKIMESYGAGGIEQVKRDFACSTASANAYVREAAAVIVRESRDQ